MAMEIIFAATFIFRVSDFLYFITRFLLLHRKFKFFESSQKRLHLVARNQFDHITLMQNKNNLLEFSLLTSPTLFQHDELAGASFFIVRLTVSLGWMWMKKKRIEGISRSEVDWAVEGENRNRVR